MFRAITSLLVLTCATIFNVYPTYADELKTYIVHLSSPEGQEFTPPHDREEWYKSLLSKSASITHQKPSMMFMYHHVITGFAAKMSAEQARVLENMEEAVSVNPENVFQLHTTRSPSFLGLRKYSFRRSSNYGKGIIIGLLDSGITPGHPSFNDKGVPPPPAKWKGKCELAGCNNKLIGIRNFIIGSLPIDESGHGTHTSSTAAGSPVDNANVFGNANGTATGMAPLAHLAMYKVCGVMFCQGSVLLAGMDAAIEDGVDVISLSVGRRIPKFFYTDELTTGSFAAIQQGIFVSGAAGNFGPENTSLLHEAPWILTVGASTIDRQVRTRVSLGNKKLLDGESVYQNENFNHKFRPLVYPGKDGDKEASMCREGSLDHIDVKDKVVICDQGPIIGREQSMVVKDAGGAALIITNDILDGETIKAGVYVLPASNVGYKEGLEIKKYLNSTSSPVATILFRGTILGVKSAPQVASFSSRGPNSASPGILKPDIIGPGVNILAAWSNSVDNKTTKATFNIISGTSMSCPHLAGTAALLKSAHPEWSPAAIKSAIITATHVSLDGHAIRDGFNKLPADIFAIGSGHVNPSKANDPGLVFDIQPDDYIPYLCGLGYTPKQVQTIVRKSVSCLKRIPEAQLNYPSFAVSLKRGDSKRYSRTMTNVGLANSTYTIKDISAPDGVTVIVGSGFQELSFTEMHQKLEYAVQFSWHRGDEVKVRYGQGHMTWVSGKYSVRTPFAFTFE